ncbi:MAG: hypothetical protein L6R39_005554, partial [Caloplaca ligustica]
MGSEHEDRVDYVSVDVLPAQALQLEQPNGSNSGEIQEARESRAECPKPPSHLEDGFQESKDHFMAHNGSPTFAHAPHPRVPPRLKVYDQSEQDEINVRLGGIDLNELNPGQATLKLEGELELDWHDPSFASSICKPDVRPDYEAPEYDMQDCLAHVAALGHNLMSDKDISTRNSRDVHGLLQTVEEILHSHS